MKSLRRPDCWTRFVVAGAMCWTSCGETSRPASPSTAVREAAAPDPLADTGTTSASAGAAQEEAVVARAALLALVNAGENDLADPAAHLAFGEWTEGEYTDATQIQEIIDRICGAGDLQVRVIDASAGVFVASRPESTKSDAPAAAEDDAGVGGVDEAQVSMVASAALQELGISAAETELHIRKLAAIGGSPDATLAGATVAYKAFVNRRIGGALVPADAVVITVDVSGRISRISVKWRKVDYERTVAAVQRIATSAALLDAAVDYLLWRNVRPQRVERIDVGTFLATSYVGDNGHVLGLQGSVAVYPNNVVGGDSGKVREFYFALPTAQEKDPE